jgi:hypothetical protein
MNSPVIRDEKRGQVEISALAMKKALTLDLDYYQGVARNEYRQLITDCIPSFIVAD